MKTIKWMKSEIDSVMKDMKDAKDLDSPASKRMYKKLKKRLDYLTVCFRYVESEPTSEYLKKEYDRISNRINLLADAYIKPSYGTMSEQKKDKKDYEKKMDLPKLRTQLMTVNFIMK